VSRYALDTNAVSALLEGDASLTKLLEGETRFALPIIVIGEYRYGLLRSRHRRQLDAMVDELVAAADILSVGLQTTLVYAQVRERLRARGRPLPENDVWLAALCIEAGVDLVTRDRDFDHVEGLRVVSW